VFSDKPSPSSGIEQQVHERLSVPAGVAVMFNSLERSFAVRLGKGFIIVSCVLASFGGGLANASTILFK
jgi:hypothetical protein